MANLTVTIDDETLKRARIRALELGTSVNRLLAKYLEAFASDDQRKTIEGILELSETVDASSGPAGRTWTRDQLYEGRR